MKELAGKTAVVIGGGGGIGRGISLALAREPMNVVVADIELDTAARVAGEIGEAGGRAIAARVDATDVDSLTALAQRATDEFGGVHVVSNNVGVIVNRKLEAASEADWAWFFEFNIMALVRANNALLPYLRAHGGEAHIVNTSSMAGLLALPPEQVGGFNNGLYTTTKHALIGYLDMLRMELAPERIGVSVLCPGLVQGSLRYTAARNRPARHGGAFDTGEPAPPNPRATPNEHIGPTVVRGIKGNRFYIFTHYDDATVAMVNARHQQVLDDFAFYAEGGDR